MKNNPLFTRLFALVRRGCRLLCIAPLLAQAALAAPVEVPVVPAVPQAVALGFEFDAVIEPVRQSSVAAQATGRIAQLLVKAGDTVRAGQVLATIDDRETMAGLQRSQAQVAQADAELRNAQAQFQRTRDLQARGFVSAAALDTSESAFKAAQAGRDQATAGQRQSALTQGFTRVIAPYGGRVLETLAQTGDLAVPGKPILTLYAPSPLRAVLHVPASRAVAAREAAQVEVQIQDGRGGMQWVRPAASALLPAADPVSQTIEWRLDLAPAATDGLSPGQQVHVRFSGGQARRVVVPAGALLKRGELTAVYVASADGSGFVLKAVRAGADHGAGGIEILAGLAASDMVATDPVRAGLAGARPAALH
jgi:RND family efflux transporter MFP subunit